MARSLPGLLRCVSESGFVGCLRRGLQQLGVDPNAPCVLTTAHQLKEGSEDAMEIVKTLADMFTVMSEFFPTSSLTRVVTCFEMHAYA